MRILRLLLLSLVLAMPARADALDDAKAAAKRGDYRAALAIWDPLARQGNARAQFAMGVMCEHGWGTDKDEEDAADWYQKAADQGNAPAQYKVGQYYTVKSMHMNRAEAAKWFRKAAEQGNAAAAGALGMRYEEGRGVEQDCKEAVKWYGAGAEKGDAFAQYRLGDFHEHGTCVKQDPAAAAKWYRKSAEHRHDRWAGFAYAPLGKLYAEGRGVAQDWQEAYFWQSLAFGFWSAPASEDELKDAAAHLTPAQKDALDKKVREWNALPVPARDLSCDEPEDCDDFCRGAGVGTGCMPDGQAACVHAACRCELTCDCDANCL